MGRLGQCVGKRFAVMILIFGSLFLIKAEAAGWKWKFGRKRPLAEDTGKLPSAEGHGDLEQRGLDHAVSEDVEVLKAALRESKERLRELEGQIRMAHAEIQILRGGGGDVPNGTGGGEMLPRRNHDDRTGDEDKAAERDEEVNELQRALAASREKTALAESKLSVCEFEAKKAKESKEALEDAVESRDACEGNRSSCDTKVELLEAEIAGAKERAESKLSVCQFEAEKQAKESKEALEDAVKSRDACEGNRSSCDTKVELLEAEIASAKELCSDQLGSLTEALNLCVQASESDGGDGAHVRYQAALQEVAEELAKCKLGKDMANKAERRATRAAKRAQEEVHFSINTLSLPLTPFSTQNALRFQVACKSNALL